MISILLLAMEAPGKGVSTVATSAVDLTMARLPVGGDRHHERHPRVSIRTRSAKPLSREGLTEKG
ncbi:hypothetical protein E2L06_08075 [Haloterrigena sp. H1]|uniref:hypothetical protein n=1 Tax=Haloterrigena sp. H1 TaxID=2552943 RepID=UPI00110D67EE|nr:hypothetical protein [Haloterrigena sp. H1]TMT86562.1 hypothetical protein E2L06_08075 [Haloterrigena sp. H1]